jgi:MFS family permease
MLFNRKKQNTEPSVVGVVSTETPSLVLPTEKPLESPLNASLYEKDVSSVNFKSELSSDNERDMVELEGYDDILTKKMRLVNDAIDEIGFTWYHLKLFFLNGMGYATDTQLTFLESTVRTFVNYQFGYKFAVSNVVFAGGMILGCLFWGFSADLIGRKLAFNISLLLSAVFTIICGAMNSMATYCLFVLLLSFAAGGNLVLDTCVFLEFLPHKNQWLLTFFAFFWGVGQTITVLTAYAFLPNNSCSSMDDCPSSENKGWRYVYYVNGCIVLFLAVMRLTVVKLRETPKFLVANNRDEEAIETLHFIANKYNRPCSLTLEKLQACGSIESNDDYRNHRTFKGIAMLTWGHLKVLYSSRKAARSTSLLFFSWLCLGIAYPLYSSFLPVYLATRGAEISADTTSGVYRDTLIANVSSIGGPVIAGLLLYFFPRVGRRGVLFIGGITTMAFLFGYTAIRNRTQNVALSSCVYVALYIYYGVLYAYTPEVMPSSARATGNALCLFCTRISTAMVPVIAWYSDTSSVVPIWICGAFFAVIAITALFLPFEPSKTRVV